MPGMNAKSSVPPQTIHIIDDDAALQTSLDSLFRSVGYATRTFGSAQDFMNSGCSGNPGCLVLDVRLPGISGLDFQSLLASHGITLPVILMTGHGDIPMTVRGMKAGAIDFLPKPFREQDMLDAVSTALAKDAENRASRLQNEATASRYNTLSGRERQVMDLVTQGKMNKQIAHELDLSEVTVKIHRGNAMRKMGARTLADLVKMTETLKV